MLIIPVASMFEHLLFVVVQSTHMFLLRLDSIYRLSEPSSSIYAFACRPI
jgi:hypothetical protein